MWLLRGPQLVAASGAHRSASVTAHSQTGSSSCPRACLFIHSLIHSLSHSLLQQVAGALRTGTSPAFHLFSAVTRQALLLNDSW